MSPLAPRIRALRAAGMSLRQIMAEVGCGYGTAQKLAAAVTAPVAPLRSPTPAPKPAYYLHCAGPGACQWPTSDGRPWKFCANDRLPGGIYCAKHAAVAYNGRTAALHAAPRWDQTSPAQPGQS